MKKLFNWRNWFLGMLFVMGVLALLLCGADDDLPLSLWLITRLCLLCAAGGLFYFCYLLDSHWTETGEISDVELDDTYEYDDCDDKQGDN